MPSDRSTSDTEQMCRVCQSDDPNTVHGDFIKEMCKPCSKLVLKRALEAGENVEEAIRHFRPATADSTEDSNDD